MHVRERTKAGCRAWVGGRKRLECRERDTWAAQWAALRETIVAVAPRAIYPLAFGEQSRRLHLKEAV